MASRITGVARAWKGQRLKIISLCYAPFGQSDLSVRRCQAPMVERASRGVRSCSLFLHLGGLPECRRPDREWALFNLGECYVLEIPGHSCPHNLQLQLCSWWKTLRFCSPTTHTLPTGPPLMDGAVCLGMLHWGGGETIMFELPEIGHNFYSKTFFLFCFVLESLLALSVYSVITNKIFTSNSQCSGAVC